MPDRWQSVRLDEIEPIPVVGGSLLWRPLRRTLGIGAFGINAYVAPSAGDDVRGAAYEPSAWEHSFAAEKHRAAGDFDAMAAEISSGLEQSPDDPSLLYDLACAEALAGRLDDALGHVSRALELRPDFAEHARKDPDLAKVRKLASWTLPQS